jgi:hypothetical protein
VAGEAPRFTVEEANALLPSLADSLARIKEARQVVLRGAEVIRVTAPTDGGGDAGKDYWEALRTLRTEIEELTARGIVLRDPESGLIDFPAERDGREVFLCWRLGEDRVGFWHGPETGFAGRQPL